MSDRKPHGCECNECIAFFEKLREAEAASLREAVLEEREACAQMVEQGADASAIRNR